MKTPHGFVWLPVILVILGVLAVSGGAYYLTHQTALDGGGSTSIELVISVTPQADKPLPVVTFSTTGKVQGNEYLGLIDKSSGKVIWRMEGLPFENSLNLNTLTDFDGSAVVLPEGDYFFRLQSKYSKDGDAPLAESTAFHIAKKVSVSVPGMSKYTDADFGFSFWYPSSWAVTNVSETGRGMFAGTTDRAGNLSAGRIMVRGGGIEIDIDKVTSNEMTYKVNPGACGYCGPVNYFFDPIKHLWMKQYPMGLNGAPDATDAQIEQSKIPQPADVSQNTMGGLHMFSTEQKESATIVPLSAKNFILITDNTYTEQCGSYCASPDVKGGAAFLAKTIIASDPSVGTPISAAEQIKVIQAEKAAYVQ